METTLQFLNRKEKEFTKQDMEAAMYHVIPNTEIAIWVNELIQIHLSGRDRPEIKQRITDIIKDGTQNICPSCKQITEVWPNPMYMHECEACGWQGDYREAIFSYPEERIMKLFTTL